MITLEVRNLRTHFATRAGVVKAVDDVSFTVRRGEVLGLVGESGSGKSVTGFSIIGLVDPPGRIVDGAILYQGRELTTLPEREMRSLRGNRIAMIFQDPMMTLNPVLRIDTQMIEAVRAHTKVSHAEARARSRDALGMVGIPSPEERLSAYPHQFSGGMRQRVAIAIALLHKPDLLIADEPTTALDVTIQAQILSEVQRLAAEHGTALIWITHDLSVIAGLADRIAVMYAGRIVETGDAAAVLDAPAAPLHRRADRQRAQPQPPRRASAPDPRHDPQPAVPATRLRLPHPLRPGRRGVRAGAGRGRGRPPRALLPPAAGTGCMSVPLIELRGVSKQFGSAPDAAGTADAGREGGGSASRKPTRRCGPSTASNLSVMRNEVVGLVGESGCGKSTLGRMVAGIMPPARARCSTRVRTSPRWHRTARNWRN